MAYVARTAAGQAARFPADAGEVDTVEELIRTAAGKSAVGVGRPSERVADIERIVSIEVLKALGTLLQKGVGNRPSNYYISAYISPDPFSAEITCPTLFPEPLGYSNMGMPQRATRKITQALLACHQSTE